MTVLSDPNCGIAGYAAEPKVYRDQECKVRTANPKSRYGSIGRVLKARCQICWQISSASWGLRILVTTTRRRLSWWASRRWSRILLFADFTGLYIADGL
jgi:hypothetical protein